MTRNTRVKAIFKTLKINIKNIVIWSSILTIIFSTIILFTQKDSYRIEMILAPTYSSDDIVIDPTLKIKNNRELSKIYVGIMNSDGFFAEMSSILNDNNDKISQSFTIYSDEKTTLIHVFVKEKTAKKSLEYIESLLKVSAVQDLIDDGKLEIVLKPTLDSVYKIRVKTTNVIMLSMLLSVIINISFTIIKDSLFSKLVSPYQLLDEIGVEQVSLIYERKNPSFEKSLSNSLNMILSSIRDSDRLSILVCDKNLGNISELISLLESKGVTIETRSNLSTLNVDNIKGDMNLIISEEFGNIFKFSDFTNQEDVNLYIIVEQGNLYLNSVIDMANGYSKNLRSLKFVIYNYNIDSDNY